MSDTAKQLRKAAEAVGHKHGIYFVMMGGADELDGLTAINTQMREALEIAEDKVSLPIGKFQEKYGTVDWDWANKRITELRRAALKAADGKTGDG